MTEQQRVRVGELSFDALVTGPADAPPMLLLHGFPQTNHCWRLVLPYLQDFRVIAPNQRGYSPNARADSYRMPELTADAIGLLDALGVERTHVVGHDWGAAVAWQVAAQHPERTLSLTAISVPHPRAFIEALRTDEDQRRRSLYMRDFSTPGFDQTLLADDGAKFREVFAKTPAAVDVEHMLACAREPGALSSWLRWYADQRLDDIVDTPAVTVPTLHVWSDEDVALGRVGTELTKSWVEAAYQLEVLKGVSHWIPEEAADRLGPLLASR